MRGNTRKVINTAMVYSIKLQTRRRCDSEQINYDNISGK